MKISKKNIAFWLVLGLFLSTIVISVPLILKSNNSKLHSIKPSGNLFVYKPNLQTDSTINQYIIDSKIVKFEINKQLFSFVGPDKGQKINWSELSKVLDILYTLNNNTSLEVINKFKEQIKELPDVTSISFFDIPYFLNIAWTLNIHFNESKVKQILLSNYNSENQEFKISQDSQQNITFLWQLLYFAKKHNKNFEKIFFNVSDQILKEIQKFSFVFKNIDNSSWSNGAFLLEIVKYINQNKVKKILKQKNEQLQNWYQSWQNFYKQTNKYSLDELQFKYWTSLINDISTNKKSEFLEKFEEQISDSSLNLDELSSLTNILRNSINSNSQDLIAEIILSKLKIIIFDTNSLIISPISIKNSSLAYFLLDESNLKYKQELAKSIDFEFKQTFKNFKLTVEDLYFYVNFLINTNKNALITHNNLTEMGTQLENYLLTKLADIKNVQDLFFSLKLLSFFSKNSHKPRSIADDVVNKFSQGNPNNNNSDIWLQYIYIFFRQSLSLPVNSNLLKSKISKIMNSEINLTNLKDNWLETIFFYLNDRLNQDSILKIKEDFPNLSSFILKLNNELYKIISNKQSVDLKNIYYIKILVQEFK